MTVTGAQPVSSMNDSTRLESPLAVLIDPMRVHLDAQSQLGCKPMDGDEVCGCGCGCGLPNQIQPTRLDGNFTALDTSLDQNRSQ